MHDNILHAAIARNIRRMVLVLICGLLPVWAIPAALAADSHDVVRATLDNGLRVILVRNTLAPARPRPDFPAPPMRRST